MEKRQFLEVHGSGTLELQPKEHPLFFLQNFHAKSDDSTDGPRGDFGHPFPHTDDREYAQDNDRKEDLWSQLTHLHASILSSHRMG